MIDSVVGPPFKLSQPNNIQIKNDVIVKNLDSRAGLTWFNS